MSSTTEFGQGISVVIPRSAMAARLRLETGLLRQALTVTAIRTALAASGIPPRLCDDQAIAALIERYFEGAALALEADIIHGRPPTESIDARLELIQRREHPPADTTRDERIDHRERARVTHIFRGDQVARIFPAQPGSDGEDVLGRCVPARPARLVTPAMVAPPECGLSVRPDGVVVALRDGLLERRDDSLRLVSHLQIDGPVDFSTGNIEFPGDVTIAGGVTDCFHVRARGSLIVRGLVDAAEIHAGGDASIERGMAGRSSGVLEVGHDAKMAYITETTASIGRDLSIEREIVACDLSVGRRLTAPRAGLVRGHVRVGGRCELAELGGEAGAATLLELGAARDLPILAARAIDLRQRTSHQLGVVRAELEQIRSLGKKTDHSRAELLTELQFSHDARQDELRKLGSAASTIVTLWSRFGPPCLIVHSRIWPGVTLHIGRHVARFEVPLRGPIEISLNEQGDPILKQGSTHRLLRDVARVSTRPAVADLALLQSSFAA